MALHMLQSAAALHGMRQARSATLALRKAVGARGLLSYLDAREPRARWLQLQRECVNGLVARGGGSAPCGGDHFSPRVRARR